MWLINLFKHYPSETQQWLVSQLTTIFYLGLVFLAEYFLPGFAGRMLLSFMGGTLIALLIVAVVARRRKEKYDMWRALSKEE